LLLNSLSTPIYILSRKIPGEDLINLITTVEISLYFNLLKYFYPG